MKVRVTRWTYQNLLPGQLFLRFFAVQPFGEFNTISHLWVNQFGTILGWLKIPNVALILISHINYDCFGILHCFMVLIRFEVLTGKLFQ